MVKYTKARSFKISKLKNLLEKPSGELMFLESYGNCDVTNTLTLLL